MRRVRAIEHDEAETAETEEKTRRQALHDVLAVDAIGHERLRLVMTVLVGRRTDARRFDDHVVNDAARYEKVGEHDGAEDEHCRRLLYPRRTAKFELGQFENVKRDGVDDVHNSARRRVRAQ